MSKPSSTTNVTEPFCDRARPPSRLRRLLKRKVVLVSLVVIVCYLGLAGFIYVAELCRWQVSLTRWDEQLGGSYQAPSRQNILGTDLFGLSVLRKTLYAAKTSISVALSASLISTLLGVCLGCIAGFFKGWLDQIIVWLYSTLSSVPYILLVLAFAVALQQKTLLGTDLTGTAGVCLAIGLTGWVGICRLVRGEVITHKNREYVLAATSYGCSQFRLLWRHILPNIFHIIAINFTVRFVAFIHAEATLGFLGLGESARPSWGAMINEARLELSRGVWWQMVAATAGIFCISLALNIFGDAVRDICDPKLKTE